MKNMQFLARPIAATAVVGVALIGFAGGAGAATVSVSVPPVLGGIGGSAPVLTIGSGPVAPAPGVDGTVPAHAAGTVTVAEPDPSRFVPVANAPVAIGGGQAASAQMSADACVAVALLSGHDPAGCGDAVGSHPSLAGSLSRVGGCVRLALAAGLPTDTCAAATPAAGAGAGDVGALGSALANLGSGGTVSGVGGPAAVDPFGDVAATQAAATKDAAFQEALLAGGLCTVAQQLGIADLGTCTAEVATATAPIASATAGNAFNPSDVCMGLAAVAGVDATSCSAPLPSAQVASSPRGSRGLVRSGRTGSASVSSSAPGVLNGSCAARTSTSGSTSPFSSEAAGGFAGIGLALAAISRRLRGTRGIRRVRPTRLA